MKGTKSLLLKSIGLFVAFTVICGGIYTLLVTGLAQIMFSKQANGSMIEANGKTYGSELLGQYYTEDSHMWGRIMKLDVTTFKEKEGTPLLYAVPSNLSPVSEEYKQLALERVEEIRFAHPEMSDTKIPVDLVTCSGSGLDPHISVAAANYQVKRLAKNNNMTEQEVKDIIKKCTDGKFLGIFGEETVNVLEVNLMIDGIIK
ncbi:MAG TPA: K(+)-transporting ATPase subunit C [Lachnoclostridium phytofermentans]|uniref:Potassium-transporting ATPase KdpC subunit n=1 Tax=Lachnoclostridium phytofermentans TaxID=66219 RepID=A0A3D2X7K3_9FIRM|nr:K(+)-transporting ATPase subunit C [Lachnoclostridium sp.]HCL03130.1 K(+)-transporting ATPase subunit C [Lachnoclostridium phytofermentans]